MVCICMQDDRAVLPLWAQGDDHDFGKASGGEGCMVAISGVANTFNRIYVPVSTRC